MVSEDQPFICNVLVCADTHAACLTALLLGLSGMDHACPKSAAGRIQTACYNRSSDCKAALLSCLLIHRPDHFMARVNFREQAHGDSQSLTHILIPCSCMHVKTMQSVPLRHILCHLPGQLVCNIAVGLKNLVCICIDLRQISLIPDDLSRRVGWLQGVSRKLKYLICPYLFIHFFTDVCRPCIHPNRRVCQDSAVFVHCDR